MCPTSDVFLSAVTMFTTPLGIPARTASAKRALAVNGVFPGLFVTTVQPAVNAGPILRVIIAAGKFHGVINPHTPTGSLTVKTRPFVIDTEIVSAYNRGASSLNNSMEAAAYLTSPWASVNGFPFPQVIKVAKSSRFCRMRSFQHHSSRDLSRTGVLRN